MLRILSTALALAAAVSSSVLAPRAGVCNADNCLRAIRNTAKPGAADCSAFLRTTVTPATVTMTTYLTVSQAVSSIVSVTQTNTLEETATTVEQLTETTSITVAANAKRAAPTVPAYASPCSGEVRYSSACSCLGVTATATIVAPAPSTWVTISETTYTTVLITSTVDTTTLSTTVTTLTQSTTGTTTTVSITPSPTSFVMQVINAGNSALNGQYLQKVVVNNQRTFTLTTDLASAEKFKTTSQNYVTDAAGAGLLLCSLRNVYQYLFYNTQAEFAGTSRQALTCTYDAAKTMSCVTPDGYSIFGYYTQTSKVAWAESQSRIDGTGSPRLYFRAVSV
ncbi:hypothetical protein PVAG01_05841 [Phlyctema vagabunda]|uniref:Uncharacterized protein n=1 Tax=Phlyctema vagabunda TaxID=108571 RepID=A0ABR4PEG8_9HELO